MSEQQSQSAATTTATAAPTSACPHPEAVGTRWGDAISEERQAGLRAFADRQRVWATQPEATRRQCSRGRRADGEDVELTGADMFWLASQVRNENDRVPDLHLGADLPPRRAA
jgi:hypothetical protein